MRKMFRYFQINFITSAADNKLTKVNTGSPDCQCHGTDRSVFSQLAERGERFLVCLANPVDHSLCVGTQHVALCALLLLAVILFLLVPVVPHCYREEGRGPESRITMCDRDIWLK